MISRPPGRVRCAAVLGVAHMGPHFSRLLTSLHRTSIARKNGAQSTSYSQQLADHAVCHNPVFRR